VLAVQLLRMIDENKPPPPPFPPPLEFAFPLAPKEVDDVREELLLLLILILLLLLLLAVLLLILRIDCKRSPGYVPPLFRDLCSLLLLLLLLFALLLLLLFLFDDGRDELEDEFEFPPSIRQFGMI